VSWRRGEHTKGPGTREERAIAAESAANLDEIPLAGDDATGLVLQLHAADESACAIAERPGHRHDWRTGRLQFEAAVAAGHELSARQQAVARATGAGAVRRSTGLHAAVVRAISAAAIANWYRAGSRLGIVEPYSGISAGTRSSARMKQRIHRLRG
jgi:hypothetical protein